MPGSRHTSADRGSAFDRLLTVACTVCLALPDIRALKSGSLRCRRRRDAHYPVLMRSALEMPKPKLARASYITHWP